jgi:hypothetical protein
MDGISLVLPLLISPLSVKALILYKLEMIEKIILLKLKYFEIKKKSSMLLIKMISQILLVKRKNNLMT